MKKLLMMLVCCVVLVGCSNENIESSSESLGSESQTEETIEIERSDLYQTDEIVDGIFEEVKYSIPKTWNNNVSEIENGIRFDADDISIVICTDEYWNAYDKKYDELTTDEQSTYLEQALLDCSNQFTDGAYDSYKIKRKENMTISDYVSNRYKVEIEKGEESFFYDSAIIFENDKFYIFLMRTKSENTNKYFKDFNNFLNSISLHKNIEEQNNPNSEIVSQLRELYKEQAKDLSFSEEDSEKYFEIVLKTSKELSKRGENKELEQFVGDELFNPFVLSAGYLCNNYGEDTEYGKVGNMAFDLIGYIVAKDNDNRDKILNEYDTIAASRGMEIITLDDSEIKSKEPSETESQEPIELSTGKYIVGEDIPSGKYDIVGIKVGNVKVCSPGKDYGDILSEIIESGETVYSNVQLEDEQILEIVNGGKVQLQPK